MQSYAVTHEVPVHFIHFNLYSRTANEYVDIRLTHTTALGILNESAFLIKRTLLL